MLMLMLMLMPGPVSPDIVRFYASAYAYFSYVAGENQALDKPIKNLL